MDSELRDAIAAATAHRACCGVEADNSQGKLHGYCVVCGVPWPCDTARHFMRSDASGIMPLCTCESPRQCRGSDWAAKDGMRCSQASGEVKP